MNETTTDQWYPWLLVNCKCGQVFKVHTPSTQSATIGRIGGWSNWILIMPEFLNRVVCELVLVAIV